MANPFLDKLNNTELMGAFGVTQDNAPLTPEELSALSEQQVPETKIEQPVVKASPTTPKQESSKNPFMENVDFNAAMAKLPKETDQVLNQNTTPAPEKPLSKLEQLEAMMKELQTTSSKDLEEARKSDRMLKIGGALGDALATYLNAQGQMNVKAPGVQVQQGAGLGKIADMFATAPEIQSDIAQRRQSLMEQYKQLATGQEAKLDRALKERQIAAYEAQTRAQAKKAEADTAKEIRKESEKLSVGEETLDREFAKVYKDWTTKGKADYEENKKIFDEAITALKQGKVETGTLAGIAARTPGMRTDTRELETRVRKGLNGMLRATLGAQFTQEEGERIFQQTFDPYASPTENIKNMETELNKIKKQKQLVEEQGSYFKQKGTLKGYEIPQTLEKSEEKQPLAQKDQQALDWANKNPNDPRSTQIKKRLGM